VLTGQTGELRFANVSGPDAPPTVQPIEAGAYTSAPTSLVTGDGLRRHGWQPRLAGWLVEARAPLTGPQVARARQVAADARDHQTRLAATRSGATAAGLLLALGILARTVGLIRGEAAGDLRTLTATGATGGTRRTLTAATGGALALLGVLLGAAGAYLALLAGYHNNLDALTATGATGGVLALLGAAGATWPCWPATTTSWAPSAGSRSRTSPSPSSPSR
jgi:putative ABC transport system permease protein